MLSNPQKYDTDGNGMGDAVEDYDEDGLSSVEEMSYGTNPWEKDSDLDGIEDNVEITEIGTNPLMEDTDEDGLTDGDEIKMGTNPLLADTDGNGIVDGEEKIEQQVEMDIEEDGGAVTSVSVSLSCSGNIERQVYIENTMGEDILSTEVVGMIGVPIDIQSFTSFDEAVITFQYDKEMLGETKEEDLCILWYDEDNTQYVLLEDTVVDTVNQTVSYTTEHFSTYLLIDRGVWLDAWRAEIDYGQKVPGDEGATYDIMICMDYTVSEEEYEKEKEFAKKIVEQMVEGDRVKFCVYQKNPSLSYYHTTWSEKKEYAFNVLENIEEDIYRQYSVNIEPSGTYAAENYGAIKCIAAMYDGASTNKKVGFVVNAGKNEQTFNALLYTSESDARSALKKMNFPVHSVSVTTYENSKFASLLSEYGGKAFKATTLNEVQEDFRQFGDDASEMLDTDGDGLYDVNEVNGIRIQNGKIICIDPLKKDTDGDGLTDSEEIGNMILTDLFVENGEVCSAKYYKIKSNPLEADTDSDGLRDDVDPHPWKKEEVLVAELSNKYAGVEYLRVEENGNFLTHGGRQGWWKEQDDSTKDLNYPDFATDESYRITNAGCGIIAMSDIEIYLMQQNVGYKASMSPANDIAYDTNTGSIQKDDYMTYAKFNADFVYNFNGALLSYIAGVMPNNMENGLERFLKLNQHDKSSVTWAPYSLYTKEEEKRLVLDEIETMLSNDLPVVFAYYTFDEDDPLILYTTLEYAKKEEVSTDVYHQEPRSHYMTIIGLYKYLEKDSDHYQYIFKIVSWGKIYYVRYDEYSEKFGSFSNILRID